MNTIYPTQVDGLIQGIPVPYAPSIDDGVTLILLCCFFLSAYVFSRSRKFLLQLVRNYLLHRERSSIFATSSAGDMRYLLLLVGQTAVLGGVLLFSLSCDFFPQSLQVWSPGALLAAYVGGVLLFIFSKWLVYSFLGWTFFGEGRTTLWLESYSTLLYYLGFSLFPLVLLHVYFSLNVELTVIMACIILLFAKILVIYKWLKLFCDDLRGCLLLILYFCALEIAPALVLYRGVIQLNGLLY